MNARASLIAPWYDSFVYTYAYAEPASRFASNLAEQGLPTSSAAGLALRSGSGSPWRARDGIPAAAYRP
ncbi:hypothetical protein M0802_002796 [Mischocyttarus mexicanus]|nr:hypothetical protein M0802_002796 [Mischocyttarus mexicanus]